MLFAGWEVCIVKNCDQGLENAEWFKSLARITNSCQSRCKCFVFGALHGMVFKSSASWGLDLFVHPANVELHAFEPLCMFSHAPCIIHCLNLADISDFI